MKVKKENNMKQIVIVHKPSVFVALYPFSKSDYRCEVEYWLEDELTQVVIYFWKFQIGIWTNNFNSHWN